MKQFSTILNIVLLIAVSVLFYLHFAGNKKNVAQCNTIARKDSCAAGQQIAYVELDSINNNVTYIKQQKKELEAEQKQIANEYENAYHEMEAAKNNFLKRGNAITQREAEEFQNKLLQQQQQVEATKQAKGQKLAEKGSRMMEEMQTKIKIFLNDYNKEKQYNYILATSSGFDYLFFKDSTKNITSEIVKGLNDKMNKKGN